MTGAERRDFTRVPFRTGVAVRTADRTIWATGTLDISMNGISIAAAEHAPPLGTPCEVEIVLSDTEPPELIEARGTIIRSAPGTLAVQFAEIDLDSYHHLRQLVANNADDPVRAEQEFDAHWGIRKPPA